MAKEQVVDKVCFSEAITASPALLGEVFETFSFLLSLIFNFTFNYQNKF